MPDRFRQHHAIYGAQFLFTHASPRIDPCTQPPLRLSIEVPARDSRSTRLLLQLYRIVLDYTVLYSTGCRLFLLQQSP